jgi:hypothetical protein
MGTVTLLTPLKSSEFGAILWLISRRYDHERAGETWPGKTGKSPKAALHWRQVAARLHLAILNSEMREGLACYTQRILW